MHTIFMPIRAISTALLFCLWFAACQSPDTSDQSIAMEDSLASEQTREYRYQTEDDEELHVIVTGVVDAAGEFDARPLIIEFSPYGLDSQMPDFGPEYNRVFVHARGTGESTGTWSAIGPRDQQDIAELLGWACQQPFSTGRIGLYGFSASAIAVYNSLHLELPCVDSAVLMAGTHELYRDLIYPGGLPNLIPELVVGVGVGLPLLASVPFRLQDGRSPLPAITAGIGVSALAADIAQHPVIDDYWQQRSQRPGPNRFPVLANTGFFDVESRGPFESYQALRDQGVPVHLRVLGAHDGFPLGTPGPMPEYQRWFNRFLLDVPNGIDQDARVQGLLAHGSYPNLMAGEFSEFAADDWPLPGTHWQQLHLSPAAGPQSTALQHGQLATRAVEQPTQWLYPALISSPLAGDPNTTSTLAAGGAAPLFNGIPGLVDTRLLEPLALVFTSAPLAQDVDLIGPARLSLSLSTILPESDVLAVLADVGPDDVAYPVGLARLRSSFPAIVEQRSRRDDQGLLIQPYADHSVKQPATPGQARRYELEFWPIGNRFGAGHRLRLIISGAPAYGLPSPGLNVLDLGGSDGASIALPVRAGNDLCAALGDPGGCQ